MPKVKEGGMVFTGNIYLFCLFFFFLLFRATLAAYGGSQARGLIGATAATATGATATPFKISATSANCTTAHGNARSLIHRARPGIEATPSWFVVRFISTVPRWELRISEHLNSCPPSPLPSFPATIISRQGPTGSEKLSLAGGHTQHMTVYLCG